MAENIHCSKEAGKGTREASLKGLTSTSSSVTQLLILCTSSPDNALNTLCNSQKKNKISLGNINQTNEISVLREIQVFQEKK